jgi:hypothetical protein
MELQQQGDTPLRACSTAHPIKRQRTADALTFADVLNAISKDAATAVIKSIYQNVTHDIDLQAD